MNLPAIAVGVVLIVIPEPATTLTGIAMVVVGLGLDPGEVVQ